MNTNEENQKNDGLSTSEVEQRRTQFGFNEIAEEKQNPFLKFLSYFWGPIPWMIEIAATLSAINKQWSDLIIISVLLLVNSVIGFLEEYHAGNTIAALKKSLAINARVKRNGKWDVIPARELVPDDVVRLRLGDIIPADAELLEGEPLQIDQSALTGESLPVTHNPGETVYSGSIIKQGEIDAVVTATGAKTFFGKTANLVESTHSTSHFQKAVLKIGNFLIILAAILAVVILVFAVLKGDPLSTTLQFVLVLTVAAIPVAMPTVLSVTMAVGARVLASKNAIVSHLASIEELSGMDVLCSDKTGTLTKNQLVLGESFLVDGITNEDLILDATLASREEDGDPIDLAVMAGVKDTSVLVPFSIVRFEPFDPVHKRTEAKVKSEEQGTFYVTKGAPQAIMALVDVQPDLQNQVDEAIKNFASHGYRSLAVAKGTSQSVKPKDDEIEWKLSGILSLYDPPRDDSKETIEDARKLGINIKMITGDQVVIGEEIAHQLGLGENIQKADVLDKFSKDETEQLAELAEKTDGFAQVFPEHKYRIVGALQHRGHIVGMTGDGVNDAPALKIADAGIAVSGATDAARSAADIVLLNPGLSTIVDAIKESRKIFQRMNSYSIYRIAETVRVLLFMTLAILVFNFYPVTAIMIVLLALLNDGAILSISKDTAIPSLKPEKWDMKRVLWIAGVLGFLGVIASFGLFYFGEKVFHLSRDMIQTLIYLKLSVAGHLTIFLTRTRGRFWSNKPANILIFAVAGTQLVATLIAVYGLFMTPIGWGWALLVWGYAIAWFLVNDQVKLLVYHFLEKKSN